MPADWWGRLVGYLFAFGAITPAMLLPAQLFQRMGVAGLRGPVLAFGGRVRWALVGVGGLCLALPFWLASPLGSVPLWLGPLLVADQLNDAAGEPSLCGDLRRGRWGRLVSLMGGGLLCGFLWEFWNHWALSKWTYDLSFLGPVEGWKLFEMPLPGYLGFLPFGPACWALLVLALGLLGRCGATIAEPLPDRGAVL
jgi:hypothetical protein